MATRRIVPLPRGWRAEDTKTIGRFQAVARHGRMKCRATHLPLVLLRKVMAFRHETAKVRNHERQPDFSILCRSFASSCFRIFVMKKTRERSFRNPLALLNIRVSAIDHLAQ